MVNQANKKIVVTGGGGFIGWHLCGKLLEKGYRLAVLDKLNFGASVVNEYKNHPNFSFFEGDVMDIGNLGRLFKDAYAVIHLAAVVGDPASSKNPEYTRLVNIECTKTVMEMTNFYKVPRFLFASSCSVYGAAPGTVLLNEGSYLNPVSLYAETRILSEKIIFGKCGDHTVPTVLRLATVYGYSKRMRFDLAVNIMTLKALTEGKVTIMGGSQYRPFVHCQDVARAFVAALEAPEKYLAYEAFNVGSNEQNYRIEDLGRLVAETMDVPVDHSPEREDDRSYRVDFSKIAWLLDFKPIREIPESIREIKNKWSAGDFSDYKDGKYYNVRYDYTL